MITIEEKLVELLDPYDIIADSYKDSNDRGLLERLQRTLGADMDANLMPKVDKLVETLLDPRTAEEGYLTLLEAMLGDIPRIGSNVPLRRKLIQYVHKLYNIKGTKRSYELLFKLFGFTGLQITEFYRSGGFDSPLTLDDPIRRFDGGGCKGCSGYDLYLTGPLVLTTAELLVYVGYVVKVCEPIDTRLRRIYYNAQITQPASVSLAQNDDGDVIADYGDGISGLVFTVTPDGDLTVTGTKSNTVHMDTDGEITQQK